MNAIKPDITKSKAVNIEELIQQYSDEFSRTYPNAKLRVTNFLRNGYVYFNVYINNDKVGDSPMSVGDMQEAIAAFRRGKTK